MSIGSLVYKFRAKYGHGLRVAYYRDVVRPRILRTPPICGTTDSWAEIHVMTCSKDWLDMMWGLKSFYRCSRRRYQLCIHDDGSLTPDQQATVREHFPDARLIGRAQADDYVLGQLLDFPRCREFRRTNLLAPKAFDFHAFLRSDRMLIFDSDLMFFQEPVALLNRLEDPSFRHNVFNEDCGHGYTVRPEEVRARIGHELLPRINSGLGLIHRGSIRHDWCEEFLGLPGILEGHFWRIEQTLIALCSSRFGAELLPEEYTLYLGQGIAHRPFRHYVGCIRHLMYREGMRHVRAGLFEQETTLRQSTRVKEAIS